MGQIVPYQHFECSHYPEYIAPVFVPALLLVRVRVLVLVIVLVQVLVLVLVLNNATNASTSYLVLNT